MYNRVILMGRLTYDPELRQTQSGISMCRFTVAVDRVGKQGEEKKADFVRCVAWKNTAEVVSRYFSKGRMIHVDGKLQNNDYTDDKGVKHYSMVVIADNITFCGDKSQNQQQQQQQPQNYGAPASVQIGDMDDFEDILSDGDTPF